MHLNLRSVGTYVTITAVASHRAEELLRRILKHVHGLPMTGLNCFGSGSSLLQIRRITSLHGLTHLFQLLLCVTYASMHG